jgi:hypothetical protein
VGFWSWVCTIKWCTRQGELLEPKTRPSRQGSVMANDSWGASVSDRGDLGGIREVQLRGDRDV